MWVKFTRDFDFAPSARNGNVTIAYKAGMEKNVTRECADLAIAAKAAVRKSDEKADGEG